MTVIDTVEIQADVEATITLLGDNGRRWNKSKKASAGTYSLYSAIRQPLANKADGFIFREVHRAYGFGPEWEERASWDEVCSLLERPDWLQITQENLEFAFGPQWREIVALIRRIGYLTNQERDVFKSEGDRGHAKSCLYEQTSRFELNILTQQLYIAAFCVQNDTPYYGAFAADDTCFATLGSRLESPVKAVTALFVRHFIEAGVYKQEWYDSLTMPWRKVIGPIHAQDERV
jgi:hypothetical protein